MYEVQGKGCVPSFPRKDVTTEKAVAGNLESLVSGT